MCKSKNSAFRNSEGKLFEEKCYGQVMGWFVKRIYGMTDRGKTAEGEYCVSVCMSL